jgi:cell division protein FtsB
MEEGFFVNPSYVRRIKLKYKERNGQMAERQKKARLFIYIVVAVCLVILAYLARGLYYGAVTIHDLLAENKRLKQAITNLTAEEQIGYAKVLAQEIKDGQLFTTVRFVETARDDKLKKILEKEYAIAGDVVHFDALIVKFGDKMVMDGKARALYLWRRVYGEKMSPESGFAIEEPGAEPQRYGDLLRVLPVKQRELFWSNIWDLANDPGKLKKYDIEAIYGNVVYSRLQKGLIYVFKISPTGQVYPEIIPDM